MIFLSVLYDEPDTSTYRGIELSHGAHRDVFHTGNPTHDYLTAVFTVHLKYGEGAERTLRYLSSWNHFAMDGGDLPEEGYTEDQIRAAREAAGVFLET
jgi:hypothetical protein